MTSYQKLKNKCEKLEGQLEVFKRALSVCTTTPKVEQDENGNYFMRSAFVIQRNVIDEKCKEELIKWVAENLDEQTICMLLKVKKELEDEKHIIK